MDRAIKGEIEMDNNRQKRIEKELLFIYKEFYNWEEVPDEDLFEDGELTINEAMIKAWENIDNGKYRLIREKHVIRT